MDILDILFPKNCLECKRGGKYICKDCLRKIRIGEYSSNRISIFKYEGVIRKAILTLKYKGTLSIASELAEILVLELKERKIKLKGYTLVPIPLHWYKENVRGFNQTAIVGKFLAKLLSIDFIPDLLIKTKATKAQADLKASERRQNLKGAFNMNSKYLDKKIARVLLFDDVLTTGSTIYEASESLYNVGVTKIKCLTIAG